MALILGCALSTACDSRGTDDDPAATGVGADTASGSGGPFTFGGSGAGRVTFSSAPAVSFGSTAPDASTAPSSGAGVTDPIDQTSEAAVPTPESSVATEGTTPGVPEGAAVGEEGNGNFVALTFTDDYTGFWEEEDRAEILPDLIVRVTRGERYYHIESFTDQSDGAGTEGLNCYDRTGLSLTNPDGEGLRGAADVDKVVDYREWTLESGKLRSSSYDENGELRTNSTATATHRRILEGQPPSYLQICDT